VARPAAVVHPTEAVTLFYWDAGGPAVAHAPKWDATYRRCRHAGTEGLLSIRHILPQETGATVLRRPKCSRFVLFQMIFSPFTFAGHPTPFPPPLPHHSGDSVH